MERIEQRLIGKAQKKHLKIYPCAEKKNLSACFTRSGDQVLFWYNTHDCSTHVVSERITAANGVCSKDFVPAA